MLKKLSAVLEVDSDFLVGNWPYGFYEDYQNASSKEDPLYLSNTSGVPPSLRCEYKRLSGPLANENELSEDELYLIKLYRRAGDDACMVVRLILRKHVNHEASDRRTPEIWRLSNELKRSIKIKKPPLPRR